MDQPAALDRLARMTAATDDPVLTVDDLTELLNGARIVDSAGRAPTDGAWVATWNLNAAACEAWRWKAGRAASRFSFMADGAQHTRSQVIANCRSMVALYRSKLASSRQMIPDTFPVEESA